MAAAHSVRTDRRRQKGGENEKIENMLDSIESEVIRLRLRKDRLQQCIEDAIGESEALCGCYLEVVGSTSWGGEVPQSDLDLVLCTPQRGLEGREAIAILEELRQILERRLQAQDEAAAGELSGHVWQWRSKCGWQEFQPPASQLLEVAFKEKQQSCEVHLSNGSAKVDVIALTYSGAQGAGQVRRLPRTQVPDHTGSAARAERRRDLNQDNILKHVKLVDAARVPILRIESQGMSCDVSIDQFRALEHRKFLQEALEGRLEVRCLIRLVKQWLRRRCLPMAAEGGIASLAWAVAALVLSSEQPPGTSVEVLLLHFFSQMHRLGEQALTVRHRVESDSAADFEWKQVHLKVEWKHRSGRSFCQDEWVRLFFLEDPILAETAPEDRGGRGSASAHFFGLTPPSIPAALAMLYVAELRLAWKSVKEGHWDALWRPPSPEARSPLPCQLNMSSQKAQKANLQMILKEGVVHIGQLLEVRKCPTVQHNAALHRRDQSSELVLQPCGLEKESTNAGPRAYKRSGPPFVCQPCHWICALPTWNMGLIDDGLSRLAEISTMVEISSLEPGVRVLGSAVQHIQRPVAHAETKHTSGLQNMTEVRPVEQGMPLGASTVCPGIRFPNVATGDGYPQQAHSDESTRASDRNSDSDDEVQRAAALYGKLYRTSKQDSLQQSGRTAAPRPDIAAGGRQVVRASGSSAVTSAAQGSTRQDAARGVAAATPIQMALEKPPDQQLAVSRRLDNKANFDKTWIAGAAAGKDARKGDEIGPGNSTQCNGAAANAEQHKTPQGKLEFDRIDRPPVHSLTKIAPSPSGHAGNVIQAKSGSNWGLVLALNLDAPMWCRT